MRVPDRAPTPDPQVRRYLNSLMPKIVGYYPTYHVVFANVWISRACTAEEGLGSTAVSIVVGRAGSEMVGYLGDADRCPAAIVESRLFQCLWRSDSHDNLSLWHRLVLVQVVEHAAVHATHRQGPKAQYVGSRRGIYSRKRLRASQISKCSRDRLERPGLRRSVR